MILTGKAKQHFEDWYTARSPSAHALLLVHFYNKREIEQFAWYIEWFDSVGILIEIRHLEIPKTFYSFVHGRGIDFSEEHKESRTQATKQAIIHANEIYNNRNNNKD